MKKEQLDALIEAVKEVGRYSVFMAISTFVSLLLERLANMPQNEVGIIVLTLALRFVDRYLHEKRKEEFRGIGSKGVPRGILPF